YPAPTLFGRRKCLSDGTRRKGRLQSETHRARLSSARKSPSSHPSQYFLGSESRAVFVGSRGRRARPPRKPTLVPSTLRSRRYPHFAAAAPKAARHRQEQSKELGQAWTSWLLLRVTLGIRFYSHLVARLKVSGSDAPPCFHSPPISELSLLILPS